MCIRLTRRPRYLAAEMPSGSELIDGFQRAITGRDRRLFEEVCAVDVHYEDPFTSVPVKGIGLLTEHMAKLWVAAPDAKVEPSGTRLDGGRYICAPIRLHGTHTGDAGDLPSTDRRFETHALLYCELDADRERLWRIRAFLDGYDLAVQHGVLPSHGGAGDKAMMMLRGFGLRIRDR